MSKFKVGDRVMVPAVVTWFDGVHVVCRLDHTRQMEAGYPVNEVIPSPVLTPTGKTVKVRAAVLTDKDGNYRVSGSSDMEDQQMADDVSDWASLSHLANYAVTSFIEADVPLPDPQTIPGKVVPSDE